MYVHKIGTNTKYKKLVTVLQVNGVGLKFEVDTGAELSINPLKIYREKLAMVKIVPSSVVLKLLRSEFSLGPFRMVLHNSTFLACIHLTMQN